MRRTHERKPEVTDKNVHYYKLIYNYNIYILHVLSSSFPHSLSISSQPGCKAATIRAALWLIQTEKQQDNFISIYHCLSQSVPQKKGALNPSDLRCTVSTLHKQILNSPQRDGSARFTCRKG